MLQPRFVLGALTLLAFATHVGAEPLGRLFTEPSERARLDQLRKLGGQAPAVQEQAPMQAPPPPDQITLDGYVTRSSGKSTTWVNKVAHNEHDQTSDLIVRQRPNQPPTVYVQTDGGKAVRVKTGETVDVHSGRIREVYEPKPASIPEPTPTTAKPTANP